MSPPQHLPHFRHPPVSETVLGVQFSPVPGFSSAWLGAFWKELGPSWTTTNDAPLLEPAYEKFGAAHAWKPEGIRMTLIQNPGTRLQIRNTDGDRMIQVQNGRLHYNWIRRGTEYPRYKVIRPQFDELLDRLRSFLERQGAGHLSLNQWEVTYVNHIPRGELWSQSSDWAQVVRLVPAIQVTEPLKLETQGGVWHFEIAPQLGRLHVELKHGVGIKLGMHPPGTELLILTLTARGPASSEPSNGLSWSDGLNCGRETIVRTFYEITTDQAHEKWEVVR